MQDFLPYFLRQMVHKTMGEIKVGDYVFNENGEPTKVIGVYPQPKRERSL